MFLKRLDIIGFKSFPDRIRLDFQPGLTAVVGPNGSGKSNIADAVRWVMGEQSVKSLRGGKMEDVIFSGTEFRRPLGYAEVIMTVDNATHTLPLDFAEVTVTRRVYRSGESEFAINGSGCRLKDIQMLFMDTGVGREGYSIIGQGRIDEILSVRSEDRRQLFEEAAGIVKYKTRRGEALSKLEREKQNLTRVNDLVGEMDTQLQPLEVQAERAKLWLSLKEQYKSVHINIFLEDAQRILMESDNLNASIAHLQAQSENGRALLVETRTAGQALKESITSADARYKLANERLIGIVTEIEKKESGVALIESQLINEESNRERLETERAKRNEAIAAKQTELEAEQAARIRQEADITSLNRRLTEQQEGFEALDGLLRGREQALDGYNRAVMEQISISADIRAQLREAENLYLQLEDEKERVNGEILHNETLLSVENENLTQVEKAWAENERQSARQKELSESYQQTRDQLAGQFRRLSQENQAAQAAWQECASRHKALQELERHHEGYYRSVKAVLRKKDTDARFSGICGAVGGLISVPRAYELAVETALGGAAQNIVTQTEDDAKRAIEMLKATREGRATFLPLSAVRGKVLEADRLGLSREPGYVGIASELASCDPLYRAAVNQLLGNAVVIDGLDNALRTQKKYQYMYKIVTLEGELLSPGGAITGGSANRSGIIGRGRQLLELTEKTAALRKEADAAAQSVQEQENKLTSTDDALQRAREQSQALLIEQNNITNRRQLINEKLAALRKAAAECAQDNDRIMAKLVETNASVRAVKRELAQQENKIKETRGQMDAYQNKIVNERGEKEEQLRVLSDIRVEIGRKTESLNTAAANEKRLVREQSALAAEAEALRIEYIASEKTSEQKRAGLAEEKEALSRLKIQMAEQRTQIAAGEAEKKELDAALGRAEADERLHADETARLEREYDRLQARKEQLDAESRRLYDEIWEEYGLTYQTALEYKRADVSAAFLRREEKRLKTELAPLADVNVGAVEAYRQLKTRHDFLAAQRDDILKAESDLRSVVNSLTEQMEQRFTQQFAQISRHFTDVFREMFGGGKAALNLLDEKNVLESGIEITAQPPGKSLQTLLLLSGGERALTAIALLFAILRMKPSPFCLLDEIEAALDDANVARFARFLRQYAGATQFIIITHRRGTMEAADTLYGVTMQEQGISKLVSVNLI